MAALPCFILGHCIFIELSQEECKEIGHNAAIMLLLVIPARVNGWAVLYLLLIISWFLLNVLHFLPLTCYLVILLHFFPPLMISPVVWFFFVLGTKVPQYNDWMKGINICLAFWRPNWQCALTLSAARNRGEDFLTSASLKENKQTNKNTTLKVNIVLLFMPFAFPMFAYSCLFLIIHQFA